MNINKEERYFVCELSVKDWILVWEWINLGSTNGQQPTTNRERQ